MSLGPAGGAWTRLPRLALLLGLAGLLPFFGCALGAVTADAPRSEQMFLALLDYGAVILAFLGGVHWGFALEAPGSKATPPRLLLGVLPSLVGWAALLVPLILPPAFALILLIAGFFGTIVTEARAGRAGLMPPGYLWLRWALSITVIAVLITVGVVRIVGARIIF